MKPKTKRKNNPDQKSSKVETKTVLIRTGLILAVLAFLANGLYQPQRASNAEEQLGGLASDALPLARTVNHECNEKGQQRVEAQLGAEVCEHAAQVQSAPVDSSPTISLPPTIIQQPPRIERIPVTQLRTEIRKELHENFRAPYTTQEILDAVQTVYAENPPQNGKDAPTLTAADLQAGFLAYCSAVEDVCKGPKGDSIQGVQGVSFAGQKFEATSDRGCDSVVSFFNPSTGETGSMRQAVNPQICIENAPPSSPSAEPPSSEAPPTG